MIKSYKDAIVAVGASLAGATLFAVVLMWVAG